MYGVMKYDGLGTEVNMVGVTILLTGDLIYDIYCWTEVTTCSLFNYFININLQRIKIRIWLKSGMFENQVVTISRKAII